MSEIIHWGAVETAEALRNKTVSVTEVTQAHLARMGAVNGALNAVVEPAGDAALDLARAMDDAHPGADAPPLWGVPVTVKINVDQAGTANSNGLPALADNIAQTDSPVVANLRQAGAVILGRTNTPEFSLRWFTSNPLHGITHNARNPALTPGGSSGGAASAVAAGIGTLAHGNDLGGSLRYPAYCCGVAALRPSQGRVPAYNASASVEPAPATRSMAVQGPIARSVADVALGFQAMARGAASDPFWVNAETSGRTRAPGPSRVGYTRTPFADDPGDALVTAAFDDALAALAATGATLVEMDLPLADRAAYLWGALLFTETRTLSDESFRAYGSPEFLAMYQGFLDSYPHLDLAQYLAAASERIVVQRRVSQMFQDIDAFMMPTSLERPFAAELDLNSPGEMARIVAAQRPLQVVNLLGLPSVALPTGLYEGVPMGVQLMGPMHDDLLVLDLARNMEDTLGRLPIATP